jgi:hypothetical protein
VFGGLLVNNAACTFKGVTGDSTGTCSDWKFQYALLSSNASDIQSQLTQNPALSYSCQQEALFGDWVTPLIFTVCDGEVATMADAVKVILAAGDAQVNCTSHIANTTALKCVERIMDPNVKVQVKQLLLNVGATVIW